MSFESSDVGATSLDAADKRPSDNLSLTLNLLQSTSKHKLEPGFKTDIGSFLSRVDYGN